MRKIILVSSLEAVLNIEVGGNSKRDLSVHIYLDWLHFLMHFLMNFLMHFLMQSVNICIYIEFICNIVGHICFFNIHINLKCYLYMNIQSTMPSFIVCPYITYNGKLILVYCNLNVNKGFLRSFREV